MLGDYTGEFELIRDLSIGERNKKTLIRVRNITDFEHYIKALDQHYDSEDAISNGCFNKKDTLVFNTKNRSQYGNGCDFKHKIVESDGNNCFIPTKVFSFINCINYLAGKEYKQQDLDFLRIERRRFNIVTMVRIQPLCRANTINFGYYNSKEVRPKVYKKEKKLYIENKIFCLIWNSQGVRFISSYARIKNKF